jgi:hypothetical protein
MAPDRELLRLLRQLAMSKTYHELQPMEQQWLNHAAMEWTLPLEPDVRHWAFFLLEKYAETIRL